MDILTFISIIFVSLVVGFVALIYVCSKTEYAKVVKENEKLKKAIEYEIELLIERRFNAYACDNYEVYNVIDAIIEELKEVLGEWDILY